MTFSWNLPSRSCFDLMTSCFDFIASCFDLMASCFDLIASCSNLNSSCLDFRAICRIGKKGHIRCFISEHASTDNVVLELFKVLAPEYAGHLGSGRSNHTCAFPTNWFLYLIYLRIPQQGSNPGRGGWSQSFRVAKISIFPVAHLTSPLLPRL